MSGLKTLSATMGASQLQQDLQARQALMDAGTVQRKARYERAGENRVVTAHLKLAEYAQSEWIPGFTLEEVRGALDEIERSPIDYGVYDLEDEFHVVQLYFDIHKRVREAEEAVPIKKQEEETITARGEKYTPLDTLVDQSPELTGKTLYDTAYLGAGASVAYAIVSQGSQFDLAQDVVIGKLQPWAEARGPGVVAHPEHMISPIRHFLGIDAIDDEWLNRANFSKLIAEVLGRVKMTAIDNNVKSIVKKPYGYLITTDDDKQHFSRKVISGIGVGAHIPPQGVKDERIAFKKEQVGALRIMSMDVFTQVAHRLRKKENGELELLPEESKLADPSNITVVLSGANGGIDIAFDALNRGYRVQWIVGNGGAKFLKGFPNYAAYLPYLRALNKNNQLDKIDVTDFKQEEQRVKEALPRLYAGQKDKMFEGVEKRFESASFDGVYFGRMESVKESPQGIEATVADTDPIKGDLLVYAQGQGAGNFELFKDFDLLPERDTNKRFSEGGNAVIGLTTSDGSLKIVGAMAYRKAAAVDVEPEEMRVQLEELNKAMVLANMDRNPAFKQLKECYAELIQLVEDAQTRAAELANKRREKADKPALGIAEEASKQAAAARESGLKKFHKAMKLVDTQLLELRRIKGMETKQREAVNFLQNKVADTVVLTGTLGAAMRPVIDTLPNDVLLNDQLTPTRSQVEASNNYVPFNLAQKANFVTDDRTALAIHISAHYPVLADADPNFVEALAAAIVTGRRQRSRDTIVSGACRVGRPYFTAEPPNGKRYQRYWEHKLSRVELHWQSKTKK